MFVGLSQATIAQSQVTGIKVDVPKTVEIVENWVHAGGESGIRSRYIFIYLPEEDFSLNAIMAIFRTTEAQSCAPYILAISIYTDKAALAKKIRYEKQSSTIDFTNDEAGRKAAEKYYEKVLPPRSGYLRAEYQRYGDYEVIDYSK